jgi:hypothetical protein
MGGAKDEQGDSRDEPKVTIATTALIIVRRQNFIQQGFAASLPHFFFAVLPSRIYHGIHPT